MDSLVNLMAPIAIALFGLVVMWVIIRMISGRKDSGDDQQKTSAERPEDDRGEH